MIWTRDDREQIQQVTRCRLEPGTAGLWVQCADHSATLPPVIVFISLGWIHFLKHTCIVALSSTCWRYCFKAYMFKNNKNFQQADAIAIGECCKWTHPIYIYQYCCGLLVNNKHFWSLMWPLLPFHFCHWLRRAFSIAWRSANKVLILFEGCDVQLRPKELQHYTCLYVFAYKQGFQ